MPGSPTLLDLKYKEWDNLKNTHLTLFPMAYAGVMAVVIPPPHDEILCSLKYFSPSEVCVPLVSHTCGYKHCKWAQKSVIITCTEWHIF